MASRGDTCPLTSSAVASSTEAYQEGLAQLAHGKIGRSCNELRKAFTAAESAGERRGLQGLRQ